MEEITSSKSGYVEATRCRDFGTALAMLEGGRGKKEDKIDHGVGLEFHKRIGDRVETGEKLVTIRYNSEAKLGDARNLIASGFQIGATQPLAPPLIRRILGAREHSV